MRPQTRATRQPRGDASPTKTTRYGPISPIGLAIAALALGTIACSAGCQPNPKVQTQVDYRLEGMSWTAQHWARSEGRCPEKLTRTVNHAGRSIEWHGERLDLMLHRVADWQRRDRERFIDRQPAYQQRGAEILWGEPEQVEDIAIRLFF